MAYCRESVSYIPQREHCPWVWKQQLPEKILHFLWLTLHGSLPTNAFHVFRQLSMDSFCNRCSSELETILHLLCDIWSWNYRHIFYTPNVSDQLISNIKGHNETLFATTYDTLWKARNTGIFRDQQWNL